MSFKEMVSQKSFWKSVVILGISFLIIYDLVSMLFEYGGFKVSTYFRERTEDGKLFRFILGQFVAAFAYGFIISFGQFRKKQKEDSGNS